MLLWFADVMWFVLFVCMCCLTVAVHCLFVLKLHVHADVDFDVCLFELWFPNCVAFPL